MSENLRDTIAEIDAAVAALLRTRASLTRYIAPSREERSDYTDWVDTATLSERLRIPKDTIRKAARENRIETRESGSGKRWLIHYPTAKKYFYPEKHDSD